MIRKQPDAVSGKDVLPVHFGLTAVYPNPFNSRATIGFSLARAGGVKLTVFDVTGAKVGTIFEGTLAAGHYSREWNASGYASGIYFVRLTSDGATALRKVALVR